MEGAVARVAHRVEDLPADEVRRFDRPVGPALVAREDEQALARTDEDGDTHRPTSLSSRGRDADPAGARLPGRAARRHRHDSSAGRLAALDGGLGRRRRRGRPLQHGHRAREGAVPPTGPARLDARARSARRAPLARRGRDGRVHDRGRSGSTSTVCTTSTWARGASTTFPGSSGSSCGSVPIGSSRTASSRCSRSATSARVTASRTRPRRSSPRFAPTSSTGSPPRGCRGSRRSASSATTACRRWRARRRSSAGSIAATAPSTRASSSTSRATSASPPPGSTASTSRSGRPRSSTGATGTRRSRRRSSGSSGSSPPPTGRRR